MFIGFSAWTPFVEPASENMEFLFDKYKIAFQISFQKWWGCKLNGRKNMYINSVVRHKSTRSNAIDHNIPVAQSYKSICV